MSVGEVEILSRAHALFGGAAREVSVGGGADGGLGHIEQRLRQIADQSVGGQANYQNAVHASRTALRSAARTDAAAVQILQAALRDHAEGLRRTGAVLAEARADRGANSDSPLAQREAARRQAARLRAQYATVAETRARSRRRLALLRLLRYLMLRKRLRLAGLRLPPASGRAALAVRAALSRLGSPYVWGATGPDRFDCSGLVQWAYRQAGVALDRTTYDQIHDGIPVPRSQIRPGDLVFPHTGHVQLAIGNNLVVEAPHAGATVRISQLGTAVAIRRPG